MKWWGGGGIGMIFFREFGSSLGVSWEKDVWEGSEAGEEILAG